MTLDADPAWSFPSRVSFWATVAVFGCVLALGCALGRAQPHPPSAPVAALAVAGATGAAVLLLRGRLLLPYAAAATVGIAVIGDNRSANPVWFAMLLIAGWCALVGGPRIGVAYWAAAMTLFAVEWVRLEPDPGWGAWLAGSVFTFLAGLLLRHQISLVAQLRAAQAGLASKARAQERNRISRDLHDVIAHSLTVTLLHVMSARLAVEHDPADAARSLAEAERLGRESLAEVRQVVGVLREDGTGETETGPLPGAPGVPVLVERFRSAGVRVSLSVDGEVGRLPATVGLAVYRILQEALTNVIKHAPDAPTTVRITVSAREVSLTVDSLGAPGTGTGHGVGSMRERAESLAGRCEAGPSGAGWLVSARFPLAGPAAAT